MKEVGCRVQGAGRRVQGAGCRVQGAGCRVQAPRPALMAFSRPGVEWRANLKSISHRCHLCEVAFERRLTKETIHLPLGCLEGGV